jgi:hypothetical protein
VTYVSGAAKISLVRTLSDGSRGGAQAVAMVSHDAVPSANNTYATVCVIDLMTYLYGGFSPRKSWMRGACPEHGRSTAQATANNMAVVPRMHTQLTSQSRLHCQLDATCIADLMQLALPTWRSRTPASAPTPAVPSPAIATRLSTLDKGHVCCGNYRVVVAQVAFEFSPGKDGTRLVPDMPGVGIPADISLNGLTCLPVRGHLLLNGCHWAPRLIIHCTQPDVLVSK